MVGSRCNRVTVLDARDKPLMAAMRGLDVTYPRFEYPSDQRVHGASWVCPVCADKALRPPVVVQGRIAVSRKQPRKRVATFRSVFSLRFDSGAGFVSKALLKWESQIESGSQGRTVWTRVLTVNFATHVC